MTSLPNLFADNYGGDVLQFWREAFGALREGSRVLDICTGNGAIALLAADHADRRKLHCEIHGLDVAEIHPGNLESADSPVNGVHFHPRVAVEATHCRSDYFDMIVGQFALEYCKVEDAIRELARIVSKGGRLVLMLHHADSVTARNTREFIRVAEVFLKEPSVFYRLRKYAEQYSRHKAGDPRKLARKRQQLVTSLNEADGLTRQYPNSRFLSVTLDNVKHLVERLQSDPQMRVEEIREFESLVKHHYIRMRDQRDASLDSRGMTRLEALLRGDGFRSVHYEPYFLEDVLFSWTLTASWGSRAGV